MTEEEWKWALEPMRRQMMREATQEEREGIERYIDSIAEPCEDAITRILKRMWNCRGKHTTSIDKVKMEQIIRDESPSVNPWEKQEPCNDCISRQAVDEIKELMTDINGDTVYAARMSDIRQLPPVTLAEKMGHWIFVDEAHEHARCSECDYGNVDLLDGRPHNYCENCGANMEGC